MIKYLLDTNICVFLLRGKYHVDEVINEHGLSNCGISEITLAELKYGAELGRQKGIGYRELGFVAFIHSIQIVPIIDSLDLYAEEKARLRLAGTPADDDFDLLIGCTAVHHHLVMVTENTKDFKYIRNIRLDNWVQRN